MKCVRIVPRVKRCYLTPNAEMSRVPFGEESPVYLRGGDRRYTEMLIFIKIAANYPAVLKLLMPCGLFCLVEFDSGRKMGENVVPWPKDNRHRYLSA